MGSNGSKSNNETLVKCDTDVCGNSDPRSPTPEIVRTPLQNKPGAKHNITKNVDLRKTFETANNEEKLINNNPILSAVIKNHLQSFDPRSPSQDFVRTPIVIAPKDVDLSQEDCGSPRLKTDEKCDSCSEAGEISPDMIAKNLCNGFYDISLNDSIKDAEEPLGSSTASNEAIEIDISNVKENPTKLLETNFDYVETDDNGNQEKQLDLENKHVNIKRIPVYKILDIDPRSPSVGIERTPLVVTKTDESADNVEDMSDDSLIKVLQTTNAELRNTVSNQVKNSDELLIYEDESNINDTPKKSKSIGNSASRTPLSCMKNKDSTHARSKSVNTLYDPKSKMSKIPKRVSHIPRLKALNKPSKLTTTGSSVSLKTISMASSVSGDCENTPPHSHRDKWDKDSSIVL